MAHVGAPSASASVCSESRAANSTHATSGRRGRTRIATTLPRMAPTPPAARIAAQAPAPPRRSSAIAGPRTFQPAKARFPIPKKHDRRPQPRAGRELLPAFPQLDEEPGSAGRVARGDADPAQQIRADEEARRVDGQGDPGAPGDDERTADRRPEHADDVPREALEGVRLLEAVGAHRLGDEADLGRQHQPEPDAVDGLERDDRADAAESAEHARRRRRLRRALDHGGADEYEVPRETVGEDTAADHDECLNTLANGEDDAERGGRADVEHREGERDPGDPVADRRDQRPGEEEAEVALPEGAEAVVEWDCHDVEPSHGRSKPCPRPLGGDTGLSRNRAGSCRSSPAGSRRREAR